jgi:hypothetical protein
MAQTKTVTNPNRRSDIRDWPETETSSTRIFRLGLLNGLLIGTAVTVGVWAQQIYALQALPLGQTSGGILLAAALIILMCGLIGWLTARWQNTLLTVGLWAITALLITTIVTYQPYHLQTLATWLSDTRFWGLPIFPFHTPFSTLVLLGIFIASFFLALLLVLLAIFQDARLTAVHQERGQNGRLNRLAWQKLLIPLPLAILGGYITINIISQESWRVLLIVNQVISTVRDYDGDLFALESASGVNYTAVQNVRDQLKGDYHLSLGDIDSQTLTTHVVVSFDNGAWITCRLINEQLIYCYDASLPYTVGLSSLITGKPLPESCHNCMPQVAESWRNWLAARQTQFTTEPIISRVGQQGGYVLMQAAAADGRYAIQCWFRGSLPVELLRCEEVN